MSENAPHIQDHEDGSVTLTLEKPVKLRSKADDVDDTEVTRTVESIHFRKPLGKDFRAMDGRDGFSALIAMAAAISEQPAAVFDRLEAYDFTEAMSIVGRFTQPSRGTGATSTETSS